MKRWTMFLTLAICFFCMMALTGCGGQGDNRTGGKQERTVVTLFPESSEIWHRGGRTMQESLEKAGFSSDLRFSRTAEEQREQLRQAVGKKPLAIIVGAVDGDELKDELAEAAKQEIPVIAYDRLILNSPHVSYFVGYDAKEIGRSQARAIERALRLKETAGSDNIEIFAGDPKDNNSRLFYEGAMEILQPYLDKRRLAIPSVEESFEKTVTNDWSAHNAKVRMGRILQITYGNDRPLSAVLSPNDALAEGIREALDLYYSGQWPFITGLDADPEGVRAIAADRQGMTIDKPPVYPVQECLKLLQGIAAGKTVEAPGTVNNRMRDVPAFLCKPAEIDKDNLDTVHWTK